MANIVITVDTTSGIFNFEIKDNFPIEYMKLYIEGYLELEDKIYKLIEKEKI